MNFEKSSFSRMKDPVSTYVYNAEWLTEAVRLKMRYIQSVSRRFGVPPEVGSKNIFV